MVESTLNSSPREETAPSRNPNEDTPDLGSYSLSVYEPTPSSDSFGLDTGGVASLPVTMLAEGRGDVPDSTSTQRSNRGRSPRPHPMQRQTRRLSSARPLQPSSSAYAPPPDISSHYSPPYNHRSVYGPHLMSTQPPVRLEPATTPLYAYHQQYHPDNSMIHRNIHAGYQHMMQLPSAVYQYQQHSSGSGSPLPSSGPPIYPLHQANHSPPHNLFPPSSGQTPTQTSSYHGTGQFQALRYPSPITSQYNYHSHSHSYPSTPVYPSPYAPSPYGQHYPSSVEPDRQSGWWYFPHVPSPPQYEGGPYPGHYPIPYTAGAGHHENSQLTHSPTVPGLYTMSSTTAPDPSASGQPAASSSPLFAGTSPSGADVCSPPGHNRLSSSERPLIRRSYHPNPPPNRSEWVMWVGNVPSDATHDEVWRFFNQPPDPSLEDSLHDYSRGNHQSGVLSVFLISRSCCAFVNFDSEVRLQQTIRRFNGKALRPDDPRCLRLVCRVRRKDDDLKAGVGGQRGMGVHSRWIKEQKAKAEAEDSGHGIPTLPTPPSDRLTPEFSELSLSGDQEAIKQRTAKYSSSSGSYASTNSSILTHYFPQRYFILKSLTQYDLDLSVEKGLWATQKHNEGILDQAFRTSQDVFLFFSVNKSGEFYGYARMAGPVRQGEHRVSWATRTMDSTGSSRSSLSPVSGRGVAVSPLNPELPTTPTRPSQSKGQGSAFFSPGSTRVVQESPLPLSNELRKPDAEYGPYSPPNAGAREQAQSAPGDVGPPRSKVAPLGMKFSLDQQLPRRVPSSPSPVGSNSGSDFELDPTAPIRAIRSPGSRSSDVQEGAGGSKMSSLLQVVTEEEEKGDDEGSSGGKEGGGEEQEEIWGESFKIEWLCTEKLPFHRTRHLRNPWNHDREVKVSRDGTELEPTIGRRLVEEWTHLSETLFAGVPEKFSGSSKRGAKLGSSSGTQTLKEDARAGAGGRGAERPS